MTPQAFTIGGVLIDNVVEADGTLHLNQIGGNALYAAAGARMFLDRVGVVARIPADYPVQLLDEIARLGLILTGVTAEPGTSALAEWFFHRPDGSRTDHLHADARELAAFGLGTQRLTPDEAARWVDHLRASAPDRLGFADFRAAHPVRPEDVPADYWRAQGVHISANAPAMMLACAHRAREAGLRVSIDPGFRAAELRDGVLEALLSVADAFLPSEKELAILRPNLSLQAALTSLGELARGAVAVKCGADGAHVRTTDGAIFHVPAVAVDARDPVGAGDAFCGGFLSALCDDLDPIAATRRGVVTGSFAVEGPGVPRLLRAPSSQRDARLSRTFLEKNQA